VRKESSPKIVFRYPAQTAETSTPYLPQSTQTTKGPAFKKRTFQSSFGTFVKDARRKFWA